MIARQLQRGVALVLVLVCAWSAGAAPPFVVSDEWFDSTRDDPAPPTYSENGVDGDLDNSVESAWFNGGAGLMTPGFNVLATTTTGSSSSWTTYFTPEASPVALSAAGATIRLSWVFELAGVNSGSTQQGFRLALVDSPARLLTDGAPASAAYQGYAMFMNMAQTLGHASPFQLLERSAPTGDLLTTAGNWAAIDNGADNGAPGYVNATVYQFQLRMTRNTFDALEIIATLTGGSLNGDGSAEISIVDPSPNTFQFDTFAVRVANSANSAAAFDTRLFQVESFFEPLPGDFDEDHDVDVDDYLIMSSHFLTDVSGLTLPQSYSLGDITQDRIIDGRDYRDFKLAYFNLYGMPFVAVAEPSACGLALLTMAALLGRRPNRRQWVRFLAGGPSGGKRS